MRAFFALIVLASLIVTSAHATDASMDAQNKAKYDFPSYPLWLARLLAPFGVTRAQAALGFALWNSDFCTAGRWLHAAARQGDLPSTWYVIGFYHARGTDLTADDDENRQKALLWYLNWASHFPPTDLITTEGVIEMLKLTPEQAGAVQERFKTWKPSDEPQIDIEPCHGVDPWKNWQTWWNEKAGAS